MNSYLGRVFLTLALAATAVFPAIAQQTESRPIGKVIDQSQAALPGVPVTRPPQQTGAVRTVVTDGDGTYTVTNLGPGTYIVQFDLSGFGTRKETVLLGV